MDRRPDSAASVAEPVTVTVTIGRAAADVRRAIGPTPWCALEVLAATPADDGAPWVVRSSVRAVAARVGVATNTAQRALSALRGAGLITAMQDREYGGRFGRTAYRLTVDSSVLGRHAREPLTASNQTLAPPRSR